MYVPPSGLLGKRKMDKISSFNKRFSNTPLRMGVVVKCHETEDEGNVTKIVPEYDVVTSEVNGDLGQSFVEYLNCIGTDSFGGIADFFEYKLRPSEVNFKETYDFNKQDGSMVIMLCMDGFAESAVIIGGVKNPAEDSKDTNLKKDNGLHMEGEYNGLNWQVNKDGEFILTFKSKTDIKGKPQDEEAGGTHIKMDKTGSIDLNTNADDDTSIKLDKASKDINVNAGNNIASTAKGNIEQTAEGDFEGTAKGDIKFSADGKAKYTSKSMIDIEAKAKVGIKGATILLESQALVSIKGTNILVNAPIVTLGSGANPTPAVISTTVFQGFSPFFGIPVFVNAIGPFSTSVIVSS